MPGETTPRTQYVVVDYPARDSLVGFPRKSREALTTFAVVANVISSKDARMLLVNLSHLTTTLQAALQPCISFDRPLLAPVKSSSRQTMRPSFGLIVKRSCFR